MRRSLRLAAVCAWACAQGAAAPATPAAAAPAAATPAAAAPTRLKPGAAAALEAAAAPGEAATPAAAAAAPGAAAAGRQKTFMHVPHSGGTSLFFAFYVKFCPKLPRAVVDNGTELYYRKRNIVFGQNLQAEFPPVEYCGGAVQDAVQAWRGTVPAGVTAVAEWKPYYQAYSKAMAKVRQERGRAALLQAMEASQWKTEHGPYFPYQGVGFTMLRDPFNFLKATFFKPKHPGRLALPGCGHHGESCTNLTETVLAALELAADPFDTFACWPGVFGCQTRMLLGRPCYDPEQLPFSEEDVDRARRTIEGFGFVGVTEEFDRGICLFDAMFPGPTPAGHIDSHRSSNVIQYGSKKITKATTTGPRSCEAADPDVALLDFVHTLLDARYARFGC
ncbi:hypothetical protein M885DRAFT_533005 [Pelagophyceae sp. CCMP2097]|nr:hypothetical protein M885DRAFT_533005 [Pelagophyceae sp. CCMP2097]